MVKNYYYINRGDFANAYQLCYAPSSQKLPEEWERIPRRMATYYASLEADRRKYDKSVSGYAPALVLPYGMEECDLDMYYENEKFTIKGRIVTLLK